MSEVETISAECDTKTYAPTSHAQVFLEDMTVAICHADNCQYQMNICTHKRLATELLKAMLDTYVAFLDKNGQSDAAELLRREI